MLYKIKQLADEFNLEFEGDENYEVDSVASISKANANSVIFLNEKKYISLLNNTKSKELILNQCDEQSRLIVNGSLGTPVWREESDVDEISIEGEWSGGNVDSEWQRNWVNESNNLDENNIISAEEED